MKNKLPLVVLAVALAGVNAFGARPVTEPFESSPELQRAPPASAKLDTLVFARQRQLGIERANPCSDGVFLRRAFLDLTGTLPTYEEAAAFLSDPSPNKRAGLVDKLLERPEFTDYWGMRWADILRVKSEFPVNLWPNAARAYDAWIRDCIRRDVPVDHMAYELLTASGSNFRDPAVNFQRSAGSRNPEDMARIAGLVFLGQRTEKWPEAKRAQLADFFRMTGFKSTGEWKEEIVYYKGYDESIPAPETLTFPDGSRTHVNPGQDPREIFAKWLLLSRNSPFAANAANRVWYWIFGRGIVQEPDDFRTDNPPSNPELLAWLAREYASSGYDLKHLCRVILNSNTYQLSCLPATNQPGAAEQFASYPLRRLEAEVLIDAINQITKTREEYSSIIPEPYTFFTGDTRAIAIPDGSITSTFLDTFGRPPRDTGLLCERPDRTTSAQRLHLLNSTHILRKIGNLRTTAGGNRDAAETVNRLYLTILSRYPTNGERSIAQMHLGTEAGKNNRAGIEDLAWALMNSPEFSFHH